MNALEAGVTGLIVVLFGLLFWQTEANQHELRLKQLNCPAPALLL